MPRATISVVLLSFVLLSCSEATLQNPDRPEIIHPASVNVRFDVDRGSISDKLTGVNMIYCFEKDQRWAGDPEQRMTGMLKRMKTGIIRYPGGAVVEAWHWDQPNGSFTEDVWNPDRNISMEKTPEEYMDLDEYMTVVRAVGAEPLVGVNISSGKLFKKEVDGLKMAEGLVRHCIDKNYGVRYYYIGNEPYHNGAKIKRTATEYAEQVNKYAKVIHSVDPEAQIIANWERNVAGPGLKTLVQKAGKNINYIDFHWYWNWGKATWENWTAEIPMTTNSEFYRTGTSFSKEISRFADTMAAYGYPEIKLCALEWNIGPAEEGRGPDEFQAGLMQAEMLMQFIDGGLEMATFWPLSWPNSKDSRYMLDSYDDYRERNTVRIFELLSGLAGGMLCEATSANYGIYPLAGIGTDGSKYLLILNKNVSARSCRLSGIPENSEMEAICYYRQGNKGIGMFEQSDIQLYRKYGMFELPPYSLTIIKSI